jgi:hypothetical protein
LTSYEHHDKDHEKNAILFVNFSVSSKDNKEKDVAEILNSVRISDSLNKDVNQDDVLDVRKNLIKDSPAGPISSIIDSVLEEHK